MKAYLVDTHIFLWFMAGETKRLTPDVLNLLVSPENKMYLSTASIWEMIIKQSVGKLKIPSNLKEAISLSGFSILDIKSDHVFELKSLSDYHKDPFDRILISQAKVEELTLISQDEKVKKYNVKLA